MNDRVPPPGDEEDPWRDFVFDEEFVKGGSHEPSHRTRDAIATYGGQRSSWRQGALLTPAPNRKRRRWKRVGWSVLVLALIAGGLWYALGRERARPVVSQEPAVVVEVTGSREQTSSSSSASASELSSTASTSTTETDQSSVTSASEISPPSASSVAPTDDVYGTSPLQPVGTCYLDTTLGSDSVTKTLQVVDCSAEHTLELVSHREADPELIDYPGSTESPR